MPRNADHCTLRFSKCCAFRIILVLLLILTRATFFTGPTWKVRTIHRTQSNATSTLGFSNFSFALCRGDSQDPRLWESRTCHFKNVCWDLRESTLVYFHDPAHQPPHFTSENAPFFGKNIEQTLLLRRVEAGRDYALPFRWTTEPFPRENGTIVYHPVNIAILFVSFWAENFGHAILDDIMPAFILLRLFGLDRAPKSDVQLLTPNALVEAVKHPTERRRAEQFISTFTPVVSDHEPTSIQDMKLNPNATLLCFKHMLAGHGSLGLQFDRGRNIDAFASRTIATMLTNANPSQQKRIESVPSRHKMCFLEKGENARRRVLNRDELVQGWRREFTKTHDVVVIEPNQLGNDHAEHVATAHECTVIITPWGGVSFFALFARKDTTVIFLSYWDMNLNKAVNFEVEALWRYQRRIMPLQYHVSKDEVELMEEFPDTIHQDDLFRRYMDWHSLRLNETRINYVVDVAIKNSLHLIPIKR